MTEPRNSPEQNSSEPAEPRRRSRLWTGFGAGVGTGVGIVIGVAVLLLVIAATCMFLFMGRGCMGGDGMMDGGMMSDRGGGDAAGARSAPSDVADGSDTGASSGDMMGGGMGMMGRGGMPDWMMSGEGMMSGNMMRDMRNIRGLLTQHEKIDRRVENIPGGVRTVTTSKDPQVAESIRRHVRQMKQRMEEGQPIRMMDPLFRALFQNREKITLQIEDVPGGVRVTETSDAPQVVKLIRQHAREFVNKVVERGMRGAMGPTPLPEGYPSNEQ